jgi:poly(A) polymerase
MREKLNHKLFSKNAINVCYILQDNGFMAYIVGGSVRDVLLGLNPKDFDIATDAHPEEIKKIFKKKCRLIGKRFRLAHLYYGNELIEVATFRAEHHHKDKTGRLITDNFYGNLKDDVTRRDFTINSLYYDPRSKNLIDKTTAKKDIKNKQVKFIGETTKRIKEDPVRILRVLRFMAKLKFWISDDLKTSIQKQKILLKNIPAARIYEEYKKFFHHGHALDSYLKLKEHDCLQFIFLDAKKITNEKFILSALQNSDNRYNDNLPLSFAFLMSVFLYHRFEKNISTDEDKYLTYKDNVEDTVYHIFKKQNRIASVPKFAISMISDIWYLQQKMELCCEKNVKKIARHRRFRAAYDFFALRAISDKNLYEQQQLLGKIKEQS